MRFFPQFARLGAFALPLALFASPLSAQDNSAENAATEAGTPASLQGEDEVPWLYEGSDLPFDREWKFGVLDNGLRYAVRHNGVPPGQVSIRIRMDVGGLHERDDERGYAHLLEHLLFRESTYIPAGEGIRTWQRLGAGFGNDTNATTSHVATTYKLDMPEARGKLDQTFRLLSGMIKDPVLSPSNVAAEVPIVLAERRETGGAARRYADAKRETLFAGQRLANRAIIGTEETLRAATAEKLQDFYHRWYRPENTVISIAGDFAPEELALYIEKYFSDWQGIGEADVEPNFGDPVAPSSATGAPPVGETTVLVEPDLPRTFTYSIMRPWRPVQDTVVYNEGLLMDALATQLLNRRLEKKARAGGSYLYATVAQDDVSRSADVTEVIFAPLTEDWQAALTDVRAIIADAITEAPTQEEIDREVAEFDVGYQALVDEAEVEPAKDLADSLMRAVDIRETTVSAETVLTIFRAMKPRVTPDAILSRLQALFDGDVVRSIFVTPDAGNVDEAAVRTALLAPVEADASARLAAQNVNWEDQPAIGTAGEVVSTRPLGSVFDFLNEIEVVELSNGVRAQLWANDAEPGRVAVKVRFGSGYRGFTEESAPYAALGEIALVSSGMGELGEEEIDRIRTGSKITFDFAITDTVFQFTGQTRREDLANQLYLFAAKLGMPRWDENPVIRAQAAARLSYDTYSISPDALLNRDLEYLLSAKDPRFATPTPEMIARTSPKEFREVWEPLLKQGPVEVMIYGDFDRDEALDALTKTFGALPERASIPDAAMTREIRFPTAGESAVLKHRGNHDQAAAVVAWPLGGGIESVEESRQIEILTRLFSNRLLESMREQAGASYAPYVGADWPLDQPQGGTMTALAQVSPELVPTFFAEAEAIAEDLAANPPTQDELDRVIEPLKQLLNRASTGNGFWMYLLENASYDQRRVAVIRTMLRDYTQTTPERMQALARKYLTSRPGYRLAIIPEGQELATSPPASSMPAQGPPAAAGR